MDGEVGGFVRRFCCVFIVFCISFSDVEPNSITNDSITFPFDQIKRDLFLQNGFNFSTVVDKFENKDRRELCLNGMNEIKNGLESSLDWSLELIDSWGRVPSTIPTEESFEFGEFSQCLNIERSGQQYATQYCVGQLVFNVDHTHVKHSNAKTTWFLPRPETGIAVNFGACLPHACPLDAIEPIFNNLIQQNDVDNVTVRFFENTCAFKETAADLRAIDIIAIMFFGTILSLILASTSYDILCTCNGREKSQILLAFSFYTNGMKLFACQNEKAPGVIGCLHGIRAMSAFWVVLFHSIKCLQKIPHQNQTAPIMLQSEYHSMIIYSAYFALETFFLLSGLLNCMSMLKTLEKNGRINVLMSYVHRYIRLTPLYGVCLLLTVSLYRFFGNGPLWSRWTEDERIKCENKWWSNLLYINNYAHSDDSNEKCYGVSWYLAVDFQLYLISPAIIYLIYRFKSYAVCAWSVLAAGSVGIITAVYLKDDVSCLKKTWSQSDHPTYMRYASWLIGIIAGYILLKTQNKSIHIPKIFNLFAWTLSLIAMVVVVFMRYPFMQLSSKCTPLETALYNGLSHIIWSVALCYIIFACVHNSGGPINWFLGHRFWQPLSRLSYSIYLVHPMVVNRHFSINIPLHITEWTLIYTFVLNFLMIVCFSTVATLAFEWPFMIIEKQIFRTSPTGQTKRN